MLRVVVQMNLKNWEDNLPFIEFAYNRSVHLSINYSPFEVIYGFNPLTLLDLLPLPINERASLDGENESWNGEETSCMCQVVNWKEKWTIYIHNQQKKKVNHFWTSWLGIGAYRHWVLEGKDHFKSLKE